MAYMTSKSKKANIALGIIALIVIISIFIIMSLFGKMVLNEMNTELQSDDDISDLGKSTVGSMNTSYSGVFDGLVVTALLLFWAILLISSYLVDSHPVFLFISILMFIFLFGFAAVMGNMYEEVTDDADISVYKPEFPMTNFIMSNFLPLIIIIAFSAAVVLYAKTR